MSKIPYNANGKSREFDFTSGALISKEAVASAYLRAVGSRPNPDELEHLVNDLAEAVVVAAKARNSVVAAFVAVPDPKVVLVDRYKERPEIEKSLEEIAAEVR